MAKRNRRDGRRPRWRERLALLAMVLFPLFVAGGFFAPGLVRVLAIAQELGESERSPIVNRLARFDHHPLLVPRDFSAGFIPELLDLDQLFLSGQYRIEVSRERLARVGSFPRSHGDVIVVDDVGQFLEEIVFKDALMEERLVEVAEIETVELLLPLCGTLHEGNCVRDDDFTTTTTIVDDAELIPEPETASLLLLGLAVLGYLRRASRGSSAG